MLLMTMMYDDNDKIIMFLMIIKSKWTIQHDIWGDEITYKQKISHVNVLGNVDSILYLIHRTDNK
jgi:hypothetical protein